MEILLSCVLLVLVIILMSRVTGLSRDLVSLRKELAELLRARAKAGTHEQASVVLPPVVLSSDVTPVPPVTPLAPELHVPPVLPITPEPHEETVHVEAEPWVPGTASAAMRQPVPHAAPQPAPPRPKRPSFFERHPDLEKFIGENLINKIGITVLVIGIGLLLQYAIGQGLISETGRTLIGLAAGGLLVFFAHRSRSGF
ncbi:MAG: DUF2339 domain-containing protein, partial [Flavobacteriales bacterium]